MTLCIAAISREENKIVTATDFLLSDKSSAFESRFLKVQRVGKSGRWLQLYAGDPSSCIAILDSVKGKLARGYKDETLEDLVTVYQDSIREERQKKIEDTILSRYGLTLAKFISKGSVYFGAAEFARLLNEIADVELGIEFLIAGFGGNNEPHLFEIASIGDSNDMERRIYDVESFHAIGEGAALSDASLIYGFESFSPVEDVIYRLCEAKVRSHTAVASVGKQTYLTILEPSGKWIQIRPEEVAKITNDLAKRLTPPIPVRSKNDISKLVSDSEKGNENT